MPASAPPAPGTVLGQVVALWRYPVKSMLGQEIAAAVITPHGLLGDRGFALIDSKTGKVASAKNPKRWARLFECRAAFSVESDDASDPSPVRITLPDGSTVNSEDADIDQVLSEVVGRRVTLAGKPPRKPVLEEYWPDIKGVSPDGYRDEVTDERIGTGDAHGGFFDAAPVHLLTTATLNRLAGAHPESRFDARRFRPNVVVRTDPSVSGFPENGWVHRRLRIGSCELAVTYPVPRCVMTTLAQDELPRDAGVLGALATDNRIKVSSYGKAACAGVYADVAAGGTVRVGDEVTAVA